MEKKVLGKTHLFGAKCHKPLKDVHLVAYSHLPYPVESQTLPGAHLVHVMHLRMGQTIPQQWLFLPHKYKGSSDPSVRRVMWLMLCFSQRDVIYAKRMHIRC